MGGSSTAQVGTRLHAVLESLLRLTRELSVLSVFSEQDLVGEIALA